MHHVCLPAVTFLMHVKLLLPSPGLSKGKNEGRLQTWGRISTAVLLDPTSLTNFLHPIAASPQLASNRFTLEPKIARMETAACRIMQGPMAGRAGWCYRFKTCKHASELRVGSWWRSRNMSIFQYRKSKAKVLWQKSLWWDTLLPSILIACIKIRT